PTISPVTFEAVPPIPISASTPAISATISSGKPNILRTADNVTRPAAGTPAVPTERSVPMITIIIKSIKSKLSPVIFAAKTSDTPILKAPPSELNIAPSGSEKLAVRSETPAFLADSSAIGNVAILLDVKKAVVEASLIFLKKSITEYPDKLKNDVYMILQIIMSPR